MSFSKPLSEREKALEEAFFREENARLIDALRARKTEAAEREALAKVMGVRKKELLDPLLDLGIRADSVAALVLAPLVAVAWADHQLFEAERRKILAAERQYGIDPDSEAGRLLATWLEARPHESLIDAWAAYVRVLCKVLQPAEREALRAEILERATQIARAFEKTLLRGHGPSKAESAVLAKIEAAFDGRD